MDRRDVAEALDEIAALMALRGDNPFRCRAFANGARVAGAAEDLAERAAAGTLTEVKGIGEGLAAEISALFREGASPLLVQLRAEVPAGLRELATVPGLGPKKARALHDGEGIRSLAELEYACRENRLKALKGFGAKTQAAVLEHLAARKRNEGLLRRDEVRDLEERADAAARRHGGRAFAGGLYRRGGTLAHGLDLAVAAPDPAAAAAAVIEALPVAEVLGREGSTARVRLRNGAEARILCGPTGALGALLVAATGPAEHLRALGAERREAAPNRGPHEWPEESAFYAECGLPWIPPELRDDPSVLEAARAGRLPRLLNRADLRGAVHAHTTWSDGDASVGEMLDAALAAGLSWFGLSDHSPTAAYAGGLTVERLREQQAEIDREVARRKGLVVLKGTESDILGDGALDYPEEVLRGFDFVVASVHSRFTLPREEQTARVLAAVRNPCTSVLGHPTGRLLLGRKGYDVDVPAVIRACAEEGVAVELNCHPARLDLDPEWIPLVLESGATVSLGPDAHATSGIAHLDHGVAVARRCGIPPERILNTRDAAGARAFFASRRKGAR